MFWENDYVLPQLDAAHYPAAYSNPFPHYVSYSIDAMQMENRIPINRPIQPGRPLRIRVLAPPGTAGVSIGGESGFWQGSGGNDPSHRPAFAAFDYDPGDMVSSPLHRPSGQIGDGKVYFSDLQSAAGGLSLPMYGTGSPNHPALDEARYLYFILFNPQASVRFSFVSLGFSFMITDTEKYMAWRNARPWAGGSPSNSVDGIGENYGAGAPREVSAGSKQIPSLGSAFVANGILTTTTNFAGGTSANGGTPQRQVVIKQTDQVAIEGAINIDQRHIGQAVDTVVYIGYTGPGVPHMFFMMTPEGLKPWDQNFSNLQAAHTGVVLNAVHEMPLYSGPLNFSGVMNIFFGYRMPNGMIVHSSQSMDVTIV